MPVAALNNDTQSTANIEYAARLLLGSGVVRSSSRNQAGDERGEQGFAASTRVVHELEEARQSGSLS